MSSISLDTARAVIDAAIDAAGGDGLRIGAVVVDAGGHVVAAQRMDGAYLSALRIAERKAYTAVNFQTTTEAMCERLPAKDYQLVITAADDRLAFLPGGVPLRAENGTIIGALGISGGSAAQDVAICEAATAAAAEA